MATRKLTTGATVSGATWLDLIDEEVEGAWRHTVNRLINTAGTSTAYTAEGNPVFAADTLVYGVEVVLNPHVTCGAAPTLAIDGLTAKELRKPDNSAGGMPLAAGDMVANGRYAFMVETSALMLLNWIGTTKGQPDGIASLDGGGKVPTAQLPASVLGGVSYQGTWNATTNSPTIPVAAVGNKGWYYRVSTAGSTSVDGINDWKINDWILSNGTIWEKIDNTDAVASVAGKVGAVTLQAADITDAGINGRVALQAETVITLHNLIHTRSTDVVAAATIDLNAVTGDAVVITGNTGIGAITLSSGDQRWLTFTGTPILTPSANFKLNTGGQPFQVAANDILLVRALSHDVTWCRLIRASGKSITPPAAADISDATADAKAFLLADVEAMLVLLFGDDIIWDRRPHSVPYGWIAADGKKILTAEQDGSVLVNGDLRIGSGPIYASDGIGFRFDPRRYNVPFAICAKDGTIIATVDDLMGTTTEAVGLNDREAENLSFREQVQSRLMTEIASFDKPRNIHVGTGQSNRAAAECWRYPLIGAFDGNESYGYAVQSLSQSAFSGVGGGVMRPLVGTVRGGASGIMTQAEIEALPPGDGAQGLGPEVPACHIMKRLSNQAKGLATDPSRVLVGANVAVGGRLLEELRLGHTVGPTEFWNQIPTLFTGVGGIAGAGNYQAISFGMGQGESESLGSSATILTRADYKAILQIYVDDFVTEALLHSTSLRPLFLLWQIGGNYTRDQDYDTVPNDDLFVGMAQWEFARENVGKVIMCGNLAMYENKVSHRNYQGQHTIGLREGLIMHRAITQRLNFEPLAPIATEHSTNKVRVHYHVPAPPIVFGTIYRDNVAQDFATKGFRVKDDAGNVPISGVVVYKSTAIDITCSRSFVGAPNLYYADLAGYGGANHHLGLGNVRDSDTVNPLYLYEYLLGSGDYASVNIAALVNKPYSMANRSIAFYLPCDWER